MRRTLSLITATFVVTFALIMMIDLMQPQPSELAAVQTERPTAPILSPDIDTDWRYTKNGWQQVGGLYRDNFAPIRTFESVHPFIWAASVMLAVVTTTLWASTEWELTRSNREN